MVNAWRMRSTAFVAATGFAAMNAAFALPGDAQASWPGRNGGLLVEGAAWRSACGSPPPRAVARSAGEPDEPGCVGEVAPEALWLIGPGRTRRRLPGVFRGERGGRFSPDGKRIAFLNQKQFGVLGVQAGVAPVFFDRRRVGAWYPLDNPQWSADGRRLVYTIGSEHAWGDPMLATITRSGRDRRILDVRGTHPSWSVSGALAWIEEFTQTVGGEKDVFWAVHVRAPDGTDAGRLPLPPGRSVEGYDWAPDGRSIALVDDRDAIWRVDVRSHALVKLARLSGGFLSVVWSPNGKEIAVDGGAGRIFVISADRPLQRRAAWRRAALGATLYDWQPLR